MWVRENVAMCNWEFHSSGILGSIPGCFYRWSPMYCRDPNVPGFFIGPLIFEYVAITPSQNMWQWTLTDRVQYPRRKEFSYAELFNLTVERYPASCLHLSSWQISQPGEQHLRTWTYSYIIFYIERIYIWLSVQILYWFGYKILSLRYHVS